jgi:hypothetical protein
MNNTFRNGATDGLLLRCLGDPLVHHGRHFGRTIHALCRVQALLTNGIIRETEMDTVSEETLSTECVSTKTANTYLLMNFISLGIGMNTEFSSNSFN